MLFSNSPTHRIRLPFGTLVLLLAVFGWGLQYKTSLYQDQRSNLHSKSLPPAKLLSEAERIASSKHAVSSAGLITGVTTATLGAPWAGYDAELTLCEGCLSPTQRGAAPTRSFSAKLFIRPPPLS
jgi:hypothetical protein